MARENPCNTFSFNLIHRLPGCFIQRGEFLCSTARGVYVPYLLFRKFPFAKPHPEGMLDIAFGCGPFEHRSTVVGFDGDVTLPDV